MKDKYIIKLAKTNKTIIIPDLGAIVVTQNENEPFIFNEFLKFNDGVLLNYITNKEKISKEEGKLKIENFVKLVLNELELKSYFDFGKVGSFVKKESKITLIKTGDDFDNNNLDLKKEILNPVDSIPKEEIINDDSDQVEELEEELVVKVVENEYINKKTNMTTTPETKKKRFKALPIIIIVLIIWAILMVVGYLNFDKFFPENQEVNSAVQINEVIVEKDTVLSEVVEEEFDNTLSIDDLTLISGKYYIIAGVFSSYENAEALLYHVKDFYEINSVEYSGVKDGNYVVSFQVFDDKQEALEKLLEYRQIEPKAWLHHAR